MTTSFVQYEADGATVIFGVPFPYLERNHVTVSINGFPCVPGVHYSWLGPATISFHPWSGPAAHALVEIRRVTPLDALVAYQNGTSLTAEDLNTATQQALYGLQEINDKYEARYNEAASRLSNGQFTNAQELIDAAVASVLDSALLAELQSRISDIDANAESILDQASRLSEVQGVIDTLLEIDGVGIGTYVQNVEQSMIDGDEALAARIALLGAESSGGTAFILDLDNVLASPTQSLATKFALIESSVNSNAAAISTEATARASGDSAIASMVSTLQTTVNGHTAAISTQATAINGLEAQYTIKVQTTGPSGKPVMAGIGLASSSSGSEVYVLANKFAVADPADPTNVKVPFVITGGVCYMQNVVIHDALIENLTVGKLTSGVLTANITQNANINVGTGKIIWSNGAYMKVSGVGFGSSNQFIDWFGPYKADLSDCTETNAISYLKTNGSAYFGGSLLAGVLANSVQATVLDTSNVAICGPFSSNGGNITVTASYDFTAVKTYPGNSSGASEYAGTTKQAPSATCVLSRSIGGGSFIDVATLSVSGTYEAYPPIPADGQGGLYRQMMGGSTTYVDNAHSTSTREFRLRITARNNVNTPVIKNTLAIQTVE